MVECLPASTREGMTMCFLSDFLSLLAYVDVDSCASWPLLSMLQYLQSCLFTQGSGSYNIS